MAEPTPRLINGCGPRLMGGCVPEVRSGWAAGSRGELFCRERICPFVPLYTGLAVSSKKAVASFRSRRRNRGCFKRGSGPGVPVRQVGEVDKEPTRRKPAPSRPRLDHVIRYEVARRPVTLDGLDLSGPLPE